MKAAEYSNKMMMKTITGTHQHSGAKCCRHQLRVRFLCKNNIPTTNARIRSSIRLPVTVSDTDEGQRVIACEVEINISRPHRTERRLRWFSQTVVNIT